MNVFELFAKLGLDTSEYDESLDKSEEKASSFGSKLKTGIGVAAGVATTAIAATTAATVAGTKAFVEGVSDVAEYGDRIDKLSQKMNMSATSFQEWDFIMQHAGTSIESMQASIKTLSNAAETGNEAFEKLGLSQEEIAEMSGEELFSATISALQNVSSETERTYLAGQLLGRGATELGALLNMSAEETEEMRQQVHELGGVLSDDAVKDAAQFQDSLQNMQTAFTGMKNSMLTQFLPSFSSVMDGLSLVFSGDSGSGLELIESGVDQMADKMSKVAPIFVKVGGTILTSLASAITKNLPTLLKSGAEAISEIGTGIISNLDQILPAAFSVIQTIGGSLLDHADEIIETGAGILIQLTDGLAQNADQIIPAIVSVIHTLVSTLTQPEVAKPLLEGGIQIIVGLISGLAQATPELVGMIPELIGNIILTLQGEGPMLIDAVLQILGALAVSVLGSITGLMGMSYDEVIDSLTSLFGGLETFGKDVLSWFTRIFDGSLLSDVGAFFSNLWNKFKTGFNNVFTAVTGFGTKVKNDISQTFENAKTTIKNAVEAFKNFFKFDWQLPKPKLPHFSVSGGVAPWGFGGQGSLPSVSIQWYKKAMNEPYFLDSATIFGAAGNKLLGGGESGSEVIVGTDRLMSMMKQAIGVGSRPITINVYGAAGQDVRTLAKEVSRELQNLINDKEKVYA
jgi:phage-related protein